MVDKKWHLCLGPIDGCLKFGAIFGAFPIAAEEGESGAISFRLVDI
jgi:hypothetical protein